MAALIVLNVDELTEEIPALTSSFAGLMQESIVMCLEHNSHSSGVNCDVKDMENHIANAEIIWNRPYSERIRRAFGGVRNAVERAGEGVAFLTVMAMTEYTVIERSSIGEGIDFWLGRAEDIDEFGFQRDARLEVKGISSAKEESTIIRETRKGIAQTKRSDHTGLPAYVIVSEFSRPVVYMVLR